LAQRSVAGLQIGIGTMSPRASRIRLAGLIRLIHNAGESKAR
jgi:hypothetical protein